MELPEYVTARDGDTVVHVFVQPRAATNAVAGVHGRSLKLKVTAPPADDRANRATLALLGELLGVPRSRLTLIAGRSSRNKQIAVTGEAPENVAASLGVVLSSRAHERG